MFKNLNEVGNLGLWAELRTAEKIASLTTGNPRGLFVLKGGADVFRPIS